MYDVWSDRSRELELVGRARELAALRAAVGDGDPRGAAVVVSGDAGVGKSRLLGEFLDTIAGDGWRTRLSRRLAGHLAALSDVAGAYSDTFQLLLTAEDHDRVDLLRSWGVLP